MTLDHLRRIADRLDHAIERQRDIMQAAREGRVLALAEATDFASLLCACQDHALAIEGGCQAEVDLRAARADVSDRIERAELASARSARMAA